MHVVIFEGPLWTTFAPLALSRPTFMLPSGMGTLLDKQVRLLEPSRLSLWVRPELADFCARHVVPILSIPTAVNQPLDDQPALLTTAQSLHMQKFEMPHDECVVLEEGGPVRMAFVRSMPGLGPEDVMQGSTRWLRLLELPHTMPQGRYIGHLWDLVAWNEESLLTDSVRWRDCTEPPPDGPWHIVSPENTCLAPGAKLAPGCVIDASRGPVVVAIGASIGANAVIEGPCYIGQHARIQPLASIRAGTTIGAFCKIGGEVSNSIISPYSNKAHEGFLGDSFIGAFANLGAGTTASNLKNTYGEVSVRIGTRQFNTGRRMLGSLIGDHTKTAIGTRLNSGSYIGYCCQLAGSALAPKFVPSFSFWTDKGMERFDLAKAIEIARRVHARREQAFSAADESILRYVAEAAPALET